MNHSLASSNVLHTILRMKQILDWHKLRELHFYFSNIHRIEDISYLSICNSIRFYFKLKVSLFFFIFWPFVSIRNGYLLTLLSFGFPVGGLSGIYYLVLEVYYPKKIIKNWILIRARNFSLKKLTTFWRRW